MAMRKPARGEIWESDLNPSRGHEQGGDAAGLDRFCRRIQSRASGLVIVVPISTKDNKVRSQVPVEQGEGGLKTRSFIKCEAVRSISTERLRSRWGTTTRATMMAVEDCLRILLSL